MLNANTTPSSKRKTLICAKAKGVYYLEVIIIDNVIKLIIIIIIFCKP